MTTTDGSFDLIIDPCEVISASPLRRSRYG